LYPKVHLNINRFCWYI